MLLIIDGDDPPSEQGISERSIERFAEASADTVQWNGSHPGVYVIRITEADWNVWSKGNARNAVACAHVCPHAHVEQRKIEFLGDTSVDCIGPGGGVQHKMKRPRIIEADLEPDHVLNKSERNLDGLFSCVLSDRD